MVDTHNVGRATRKIRMALIYALSLAFIVLFLTYYSCYV